MNIATGKLNAPIEKKASILDSAVEYMGSGGLTKLLPSGFAGNHALSAGLGAVGSDSLRRILRSRGYSDLSSSAIGSLAGLGLGGMEGGAGALAALAPGVRNRTADVGLQRILGATALGAGGEHLGKMLAGVNPSRLVTDAEFGTLMATGPLTPQIANTGALVTGEGIGQLAKSIGSKGITEAGALKDELARRLGLLGKYTGKELGDLSVYKTLLSGGVGAGAVAGGLHTLRPDILKNITSYAARTPRAAAMGLGGLGLVAAGAPIVGAGTALAGLAAARPTRDALKYMYSKAPGGTLPAMLGAGTAMLGAPVLGAGLGATALAANPLFRGGVGATADLTARGAMGAAGLTARGAKGLGRGTLATGKYLGNLPGRAYTAARKAPGGYGLGAAGIAATVAGMPGVGIPAVLAAPMFNRNSSRFIGDTLREFRLARENKRALDGLYKKSSLEKKSSIKLAAPVYLTRPAYCLDAPTMDKLAFVPQMMEAGAKFFGGAQRALFGGNKVKLLDRGAKALERGAQEAGNFLSPQQARRQVEQFLRHDAGKVDVVARKAPKAGTRAAYADIGTQYEGTADILQQQLDQGTQGWKGWIPGRNRLVRRQNMRNLEDRMREYGRQGTAPSPLTASTEASTKAQTQLDAAQQAAANANTGRFIPESTDAAGKVIPARFEHGVDTRQVGLDRAQEKVTRLTAPVQPAQEATNRAQEAVAQTRQRLDALPQYSNEQATFSGMYNPVGVDEVVAQRIRGYNTAQIDSRIAELTAGGRPVGGPNLQELRKLEQMRSASNPVTETALTRVEAILGKPDAKAAIEARIAKIEGMPFPSENTKAELDILKSLRSERTVTTPGTSASTRIQGATGDAGEITTLNNVVTNDRKVLVDLQDQGLVTNSTTPQEMVIAVEQRLSQLRGKPSLSNSEQELLQKLERLEVTTPATSATSTVENYIDPANFDKAREAIAKQRERLTQVGERTTLEAELATNQATLATAEADLEAAIRARDAGLPGAEEALSKAQYGLGAARSKARATAAQIPYRQSRLDAARASEQATEDLLNAPVANPVKSQLDAPVLKTVAEGGAKPQVVEVLSARGIEGIAPGMEEQLRLLDAAGQNTGKMVNSAAKRSGLPKAVNQVNKAADQLVNEAAAGLNLSPQELEAVQNAVRQMSSKGEKLTAAELRGLIGSTNPNTDAAFTAIEALAGGSGRSARQYTEASEKLTDSFTQFGQQLGREFSAAQEVAANASYSGMRKGVQSATEQPGRLKRLFGSKGLAAEDVEAIEAVEALTSARVQAIETAISGMGGNTALAQAARPQLYAASEAVARSSDPQIARAWARALQEPGSLAKSIEGNPKLKLLIEKEAPELLNANNKAFNLSPEQAGELQSLIPRTGRGGNAQNLAKEVELGFKPETLRDTASPRAQESLQAMRSADITFGQNMEGLITSSDPAKNSVAGKVLSGTDDVGKLTFDEVAALDGVSNVSLDAAVNPTISLSNSRVLAANKELAAIRTNSTIEESLAYIDKELKSIPQPRRGAAVDPRREALEDARTVIADQLKTSNSEFNAGYATHMRESRKTLKATIKQDSRVDLSQLRRNTDVAKVKVESSTMDTLYQAPVLDGAGNVKFTQADLGRQLEHLKSLRANANVTDDVLLARVVEENMQRLEAAGASPEILNSARANLMELVPGLSGSATLEGIQAAGGGRGGLGALGGTVLLGGGAAYAGSRRGPRPATQARQQFQSQASWGLSPLQAPVAYMKKTAMSAPVAKPKFKPNQVTQAPVKHTKIPAQSLMTATAESLDKAMKMSSLLAAPVRAY